MQLPENLKKYQDATPEEKDRRLIQGVTGALYDVFNFQPWMVNLHDIATGLSKKCRWNGQIPGDEIFSVAQHSVGVSRLMGPRPEYRLMGLLHDASEGVMVDLITPMKREMPDFVAVEDHVQAVIYTHFDLSITPEMDRALATADRLCLEYEANEFERCWTHMQTDRKFTEVFDMPIMGCADSKRLFIAEFNSIVTEILTS
ncbi:hypothetical protein HNR26_002332 [Rhizobium rosettiformans]|uniref:HD family hydrolase n=2 Tax=Rhizobium rosettiformans TaxID=1368430 RepID=A0A4S8Q307_9HYPH|nr:hypothetical protein [Rhizobium rosettiformans]MBB5276280.1 hypothetical protein [Rhizobium rosettiformans]THV36912.1 hypothetical protein FAA86_10480 [Rhizobium rosettiformans W3]